MRAYFDDDIKISQIKQLRPVNIQTTCKLGLLEFVVNSTVCHDASEHLPRPCYQKDILV